MARVMTIGRTVLTTAGLVMSAAGALAAAPLTLASPGDCYTAATADCTRPGGDVNGFFNYLDQNDQSVDTVDLRNASLDMASAICGEFDAGMTNGQVGDSLMHGRNAQTAHEAATWVVASVDYMCPEYEHLLG